MVASERLIKRPTAVTQDKKIKGLFGISEKFISIILFFKLTDHHIFFNLNIQFRNILWVNFGFLPFISLFP